MYKPELPFLFGVCRELADQLPQAGLALQRDVGEKVPAGLFYF